jgi:hypothetical protein
MARWTNFTHQRGSGSCCHKTKWSNPFPNHPHAKKGSQENKPGRLLTRQPGCLHETRGFPSPPHGGFGFTRLIYYLNKTEDILGPWGCPSPFLHRSHWRFRPLRLNDRRQKKPGAFPRQPGLFLKTHNLQSPLPAGLSFFLNQYKNILKFCQVYFIKLFLLEKCQKFFRMPAISSFFFLKATITPIDKGGEGAAPTEPPVW